MIQKAISTIITALEVWGIIDKDHTISEAWSYIFYGAIAVLCVAAPIAAHLREKKQWKKRLKTIASKLHDISNDIRNHHTKLNYEVDIDIELIECGRCVVDRLKEILDCLTGKKTHVSIRIIDNSTAEPLDLSKASCSTICWDKEKKMARPDDKEPSLISKYTPLIEIGQKDNAYFARNWITSNKFHQGQPYVSQDSTWSNYYKSVLVVPVRIKTVYLAEKYRGDGEYTVMGFIWCDWQARLALPILKKHRETYTNLLLSVADTFFHFLLRIREIQNSKM